MSQPALERTIARIKEWFDHRADHHAELERWLAMESGSGDKAGIDRFGREVAGAFARLGGEVKTHPHDRYGDAQSIIFPERGEFAQRPTKVVLLGHLDTVWPRGTEADWTTSKDDGWVTGPGVLDMKGGIFVALEAVRCLRELDTATPRLEVLLTSDEEIGSPWGSELIARRMRDAQACLVFEPALDGGALKTTRHGVAYYELSVRSSGGHPGHRRTGDTNAVVELATLLLKVIEAGGAHGELHVEPTRQVVDVPVNVIPSDVSVTLDVRYTRTRELASFEQEVNALLSATKRPDAEGTIREVRTRRPPLENTDGNQWLTDLVLRAADLLGQRVEGGVTAGASDAGYVAEREIPVVDGLGPWGTGIHAVGEAVPVEALTLRGELVAASLVLVSLELAHIPDPRVTWAV